MAGDAPAAGPGPEPLSAKSRFVDLAHPAIETSLVTCTRVCSPFACCISSSTFSQAMFLVMGDSNIHQKPTGRVYKERFVDVGWASRKFVDVGCASGNSSVCQVPLISLRFDLGIWAGSYD